jgi:PAT family beta-lactamase induction signal transducer AmpG
MKPARNPWWWVPSLYFAEGVPYVVVMTVSVVMFKRLGASNTEIGLYTSWLYLPWVIKPLWSPLVDVLRTKRWWIISMQLLIGAGLCGVALAVPTSNFIRYTMAFYWLMAFSSATHDIAADGFYMLGMSSHDQAWFVGIRSTFYRLAMIAGQGLLVMLAGMLETSIGTPRAWSAVFFLLAGLFLALCAYHQIVLPRPAADAPRPRDERRDLTVEFSDTFAAFFRKPQIVATLAFLLFFRFAEGQIVKMAQPFMLDTAAAGGLELETSQVGFIYGTVGVLMLTLGGITGGFLAAWHGLRFWLWWMVAAINVPNAVYVYLATMQPTNPWLINGAVAIEQFGYGFGFTAYLLFMLYVSRGKHETAHYALCTGLMALGMMLPGMVSGALADWLGYRSCFWWVLLATIPSFAVTMFVEIDRDYGRRTADEIA